MRNDIGAFLLGWTLLLALTRGELLLTEIADKGTSDGVCNGNDWIEIYNNATEAANLFGYILHDVKGFEHPESFTFPEGTVLQGMEYMILCTKQTATDNSPPFGIAGDDTITLATLDNTPGSIVYNVISSVGPLPNSLSRAVDVTYALDSATGAYQYTSTPTPGSDNVMTAVATPAEQAAELKAQLAQQDTMGTNFFNMDRQGYPVSQGMDPVLDLHITMEPTDYQYMVQNASFEVYVPFQSAYLTTRDAPDQVLWNLPEGGRVRPKGQFSLFNGICLGTKTIPFQLDFAGRANNNVSQTLFGVERVYLRSHVSDNSYARDWAYYRMAARFGLPHLRARKVRFWIHTDDSADGGTLQGFYTLLEAPDQDYVFVRNMPNYDPNNYALYKVKTMSLGCGQYEEAAIEKAEARINETATPPYSFQRGEHKPVVQVKGPQAVFECIADFFADIGEHLDDSVLAYVREKKSCPDMLLKEGLIDRDLGTSTWDDSMKELIRSMLSGAPICETQAECANAYVAQESDMENMLKMMAFYAVTLNTDSPMGNGNNYYLVRSGEDGATGGWKIFPYDFNTASTVSCNAPVCNSHMVHWSIARPTCVAMESHSWVGPLLSDPSRHAQYLEYVREFVDTVYANETFVQEIQDLIQAQDADVRSDYWSYGGMRYDDELSPDASQWEQSIPFFPLLPTIKARAEDVRAQLDAIADGTYPRGPHNVGIGGDYEPWETCPDWRLSKPALIGGCAQDCRYEGCHTPGWTVESFCDAAAGICYHGDFDEKCTGIPDLTQYEGMEDRNGQRTACFNVEGVPTKMSECPTFEGQAAQGSTCPENCMYEGCHQPNWTLPSWCDPELGACYHGDKDDQCAGIEDLAQYDGMEDRNGIPTVCFLVAGVPTEVSDCPPYVSNDPESPAVENPTEDGESPAEENVTSDAEGSSCLWHSWSLSLLASLMWTVAVVW